MAKRLTERRIALAAATLGGLLGAYQLSRPGVLTGVLGFNFGYDDSVHVGVPTRIVHGAMPYRDFVFVHPPGIAYLLLPFAVVGLFTSTFVTVVLARILTVLVVAVNAGLAGWLVRRSGRLAVGLAGGAVALWPLTVSVSRNTELEPFLILFCLLGAHLVFTTKTSSTRALVVGGAALGFAAVVKVWAVLPIVAALLCCLPEVRRRFRPVAIGIVIGGVVPLLPFFVLAPSDFLHDVIASQLNRKSSALAVTTPFGDRLLLLTGFGGWGGLTDNALPAAVFFLALAALTVVAYGLAFRHRTRVEWFVLVAAVISNAGMFANSEFYDHYAYFPMVFLALVLGVSVAGTVRVARDRIHLSVQPRRILYVAGAVVAVVAGVVAVAHDTAYARLYLAETSDQSDVIRAAIPKGACAVSDYPIDLLIADRFNADRSDCPDVVDPFGMYLTEDDGRQPHPDPPYEQEFLDLWKSYLEKADYVLLRIEYSSFLPWSQDQINWFAQHYELIARDTATYERFLLDSRKTVLVYRNRERTTAPALSDANALVQRGLDSLNAGRTDDAIRDFNAALEIDGRNAIAAYDLGVIAQQRGDLAEARRRYEQAVASDGTYVSARNNLAIVLTALAPNEAVKQYEILLQQRPNDAQLHLRFGKLLRQLGQQERSRSELDAAVRLDPSLSNQTG